MPTPTLDYQTSDQRGERVWVRGAARGVLFVVGLVITYAAVAAIAMNKPHSLRGARVGGEWFPVYENDRLLNLAAVTIVAAVVGMLVLARRRLRLSWAFIVGQCFGLLAALFVIVGK